MMRQFHRVCFVGAELLSRIFLLAIVAWGAFSIEGHKLCAQNLERLSRYEETLYGEKIFVNGDYRMMCDIRTYWSDMVVKKLESSARPSRLSVHLNTARVGSQKSRDQLDEGGFSASVGPQQSHDLAALHRKIEIL